MPDSRLLDFGISAGIRQSGKIEMCDRSDRILDILLQSRNLEELLPAGKEFVNFTIPTNFKLQAAGRFFRDSRFLLHSGNLEFAD